VGTPTSANYRAAGRARSRAEFIAKLGVFVEEADENACLSAANEKLKALVSESAELRAIFCAALRTARRHHTAR
jgi:hypothetical protein